MAPVDLLAGEIDRNPGRQIGGPGIGLGIGFEEHRLLVQAADPDANDRLAVAMMIVAELRELLAGNEEGRLPVRDSLLGLRQFERGIADFLKRVGHRLTNSLNTSGYNRCSAASTRRSRLEGVSPRSIGTSTRPRTSPASSSSVTICTEHPPTSSPAWIARTWVSSPRYLGSREGWMLRIRPRHCSTNQGERMRMKPARAMVPTWCSSRTVLSSRSYSSLPIPLLSS